MQAKTAPVKRAQLKRLVSKISQISSLPVVAARVMEVTANPRSSAADLQAVMLLDPAFTARILRVVNSAYYGLRQTVLDVKKAIVYLGFKTVRNLALAASVCEMFKEPIEIGEYTREKLWKHLVAVAVGSQVIAGRTRKAKPDDVFSAGIMHDIGIILEDQYLHKTFLTVMYDPHLETEGLPEVELALMGFDHAQMGAAICEEWKLPDAMTAMVRFHHDLARAPEEHQVISAVIYLADVLCNTKNIGYATTQNLNEANLVVAMQLLGLSQDDLAILLEEIPKEVANAKDLLNILEML